MIVSVVSGKGGVGKTVMAGAAAVGLAQRGHRVLLASTNPVHSLSSMLDQDVFGKPTPVEGVPNLWAYEIDTRDTIERAKQDIREKIAWFLKYADIKGRAEEFIEAATMPPAFEESAMFENMLKSFSRTSTTSMFSTPRPRPTRDACWVCPRCIPCG